MFAQTGFHNIIYLIIVMHSHTQSTGKKTSVK
jgi:hypothetical protein